jgi:hypothetical protein
VNLLDVEKRVDVDPSVDEHCEDAGPSDEEECGDADPSGEDVNPSGGAKE